MYGRGESLAILYVLKGHEFIRAFKGNPFSAAEEAAEKLGELRSFEGARIHSCQ
jgi:hypothetical protein